MLHAGAASATHRYRPHPARWSGGTHTTRAYLHRHHTTMSHTCGRSRSSAGQSRQVLNVLVLVIGTSFAESVLASGRVKDTVAVPPVAGAQREKSGQAIESGEDAAKAVKQGARKAWDWTEKAGRETGGFFKELFR